MVITRATLRTTAWDEIYTYLQTTNAISTNNIFSSWNSTLASDKGYPLVIIEPPLASFEKINVVGDMTSSEVAINIQVYNTSSQSCKSLADEVIAKLIAGRVTFSSAGLKNMQIDAGSYDTWREGEKKIHRITFDITFMYVERS